MLKLFWHPFSHRRTSIGEVSLLLRSHVACVLKPSQNKQKQNAGNCCKRDHRIQQKTKYACIVEAHGTHLPDCCGKDKLRKFYWDLDGESAELGMSVCSSKTRIILVGLCG